MKYVKSYIVSASQTMGLYRLSASESSVMGGEFALFKGVLSKYALKEMDHLELLKGMQGHYYERVLETMREADYLAKCVELSSELRRVKTLLDDIKEFSVNDVVID